MTNPQDHARPPLTLEQACEKARGMASRWGDPWHVVVLPDGSHEPRIRTRAADGGAKAVGSWEVDDTGGVSWRWHDLSTREPPLPSTTKSVQGAPIKTAPVTPQTERLAALMGRVMQAQTHFKQSPLAARLFVIDPDAPCTPLAPRSPYLMNAYENGVVDREIVRLELTLYHASCAYQMGKPDEAEAIIFGRRDMDLSEVVPASPGDVTDYAVEMIRRELAKTSRALARHKGIDEGSAYQMLIDALRAAAPHPAVEVDTDEPPGDDVSPSP